MQSAIWIMHLQEMLNFTIRVASQGIFFLILKAAKKGLMEIISPLSSQLLFFFWFYFFFGCTGFQIAGQIGCGSCWQFCKCTHTEVLPLTHTHIQTPLNWTRGVLMLEPFPRGPVLSIWPLANSWWEPASWTSGEWIATPAACISTVAVNLNILSPSHCFSYFI